MAEYEWSSDSERGSDYDPFGFEAELLAAEAAQAAQAAQAA